MIMVLIADDQALIRERLSLMLGLYDEINIVGEASNGKECIDLLEQKEVDVIFMDIRIPIMDGVEATKVIKEKHPDIRILILTSFNKDEYIFEGLNNGADGYILKDVTSKELVDNIKFVYEGNTMFHGEVAIAKAVKKGKETKDLKPYSKEEIVKPNKDFNMFLILMGLFAFIFSLTCHTYLIYIADNITNELYLMTYLFFPSAILSLFLPKRFGKLSDKYSREKIFITSILAMEILYIRLVALSMNLDVISNIIDEDKDKAKELLIKCQHLTKESMDSLRKAVYTLKEEDLSQGLIDSLEALINNINDTSNIDIVYHIDENIEDVPLELKSIIYTTIKESLTNSIKHGKSTEIDIILNVNDEI